MCLHVSTHPSALIKTKLGPSEEKLIPSLNHIKAVLFSLTLILDNKFEFFLHIVLSLVIIFVFNAPRNKIKNSFESVHRQNILFLF